MVSNHIDLFPIYFTYPRTLHINCNIVHVVKKYKNGYQYQKQICRFYSLINLNKWISNYLSWSLLYSFFISFSLSSSRPIWSYRAKRFILMFFVLVVSGKQKFSPLKKQLVESIEEGRLKCFFNYSLFLLF